MLQLLNEKIPLFSIPEQLLDKEPGPDADRLTEDASL